jgi:hypothetical protein
LEKKNKKEETKHRNPEPPAHTKLLHATLHWENRKAPALPDSGSNLPRRCRQTELDAKGVTPELLRLKFYCFWTGNFFSFLSVCLSCSLFDCPPSLPVDFFGSPFFSFFFFFLFLSWFC